MEQVMAMLSDITPHPSNHKKHPPEQIKELARAMAEHGVDQPIVLDADWVIIKGHGRYEAALLNGWAEFPVVIRTDLSKAEADLARMVDNEVASTEWDFSMLRVETEALLSQGVQAASMGFSEDALTRLLSEKSDLVEPPKALSGLSTKHRCPKCFYRWG